MEYTTEVRIDLPRSRVIELFDNFENLKKWQPGLQTIEHLSGEPGEPGAKTRMLYNEGGRKTEMVETVLTAAFPDEFSATYEAKGVWNIVANRFYEEGPSTTRWELETEFRFSGLMKFMAMFMRGAFPKQTHATMLSFKKFAEGES